MRRAPGGGALEEAALRAILTQRLADYKAPKHILFLDELPKAITEKVRPAELAQLVQERLRLS